jgi:tRNA (adenine57-N1/adenine58-N1)-methyltransferase
MLSPGTKVILLTQEGRKFIAKVSSGMIDIPGLGVIDGDGLSDSSYGDHIKIGAQELIVLKPSVKDLLSMVERKAQIMIPKDSFLIPMHLDISCGSRVVEGGVGSGALTLVLLKAVAPSGKIISYELRKDHADLAKRNVAMTDLEKCWELRIGDICSVKLEKDLDAAVLDIPNPWDAIENVERALKVGGHICCYIPNANQLADAVKKMRETGFSEVVSIETIQREMVVHEGGVRPSFDSLGHTGYLAFGRKMASKESSAENV